jgi:hypothetical protein
MAMSLQPTEPHLTIPIHGTRESIRIPTSIYLFCLGGIGGDGGLGFGQGKGGTGGPGYGPTVNIGSATVHIPEGAEINI